MTQPQQVTASPAPVDAGQPPAWFVLVVLVAGLLFVGGATVAGILVVTSQEAAAPASVSTSTARQPVNVPSQPAPTSQPVAAEDCGPCGWQGTVCENGKCRLQPRFVWQARPSLLMRRRGLLFGNGNSQVCIAPAGTLRWVCSPELAATGTSDGKDLYRFPVADRPATLLTREDLEQTGVDIQLRGGGRVFGERKAARYSALIANSELMKGGVRYRIDDDDSVVIKLDVQ